MKVNRRYLGKPSVNAMKTLLAMLNLSLRLEEDMGASSGGAMLAERLLKVSIYWMDEQEYFLVFITKIYTLMEH